ncbi:hypothetical protein AAMO2058_000652600 [Amorphochlora amoebiformis]
MFSSFNPTRSGPIGNQSAVRSVQEGQKITNVLEARTSTFLSALDNHSLGSKLDRLALSCAQPPLDLSIKNRIQITSDRSFNWCQESLKPSLFPASLNRHLGGDSRKRKRDPQIEFSSLLISWIHKSSGDSKYTSKRDWDEWEAAFRNAYYGVRTGNSPYVYLEHPHCTVMFMGGGKRGRERKELRALFSYSSPVMRESLENRGIKFEMPLERPRKVEQSREFQDEILEDIKAVEAVNPGVTRSLSDRNDVQDGRTVRAAMVITGRRDVHALFNHLLNSTGHRPTDGIPQILSPKPFKGATMNCARIVRNSRVLIDNRVKSKLELEGCFFPHATAMLLGIFAKEQGDFEAILSTRGDTSNFNMLGMQIDSFKGDIKADIAIPEDIHTQDFMLTMRKVHGIRRVKFRNQAGYTIVYGLES